MTRKLIILALLVVFSFAFLTRVKASNFTNTITSPSSGTVTTDSILVVSGTTNITPNQPLTLELLHPGGTDFQTVTSATCNIPCGPSYTFTMNISGLANGQYYIRTKALISIETVYSNTVSIMIGAYVQNPAPSYQPNTSTGTTNSTNTTTTTGSKSPTPTPKTSAKTGSPSPNIAASPTVYPSPLSVTSVLPDSKVLARLTFNLDQDKPLHLETIESRQSAQNEKFIYLTGKSYPNSVVTITIYSQPLVLSATTDASGSWSYALSSPLEPGAHNMYVEVQSNGATEKSGPYPFNVARASASDSNPTGASLDLVDTQAQQLRIYIYIASGIVLLGLIGLIAFLVIKRKKSNPVTAH